MAIGVNGPHEAGSMHTAAGEPENLLHQNEALRRQLEEVEDLVHAIRSGRVDGFLISRPDGERVLMLESAQRPYRILVERMQQGAVATASDGTVLYCNQRFAEMVRLLVDQVIGNSVYRFLATPSQIAYAEVVGSGSG